MKHISVVLAAMVVLAGSAYADAPAKKSSPVEVTTASYQLKAVRDKKGHILKDKKGKPIRKWRKATKVVPGTVVKYVDTVTNHTDQPLKGVAIKNPINKHLAYVAETATSETKATITFSVDGGKHFDRPSKLYVVNKKGKKHLAQPKEYNAIRWVIDTVPANGNVTVAFKAKLK